MKYKELRITKIKADVPIPKKQLFERKSTFGKSRYPFTELKVGESFSIIIENSKRVSNYMGSYVTALKRKKILPESRKFVIRKLEKEVRVWRTK